MSISEVAIDCNHTSVPVPYCNESTYNSIKLSWELPDNCPDFDEFIIKNREKGQTKFTSQQLDKEKRFVNIRRLKSETSYEVRVYFVVDGNEKEYFRFEEITKTWKKHPFTEGATCDHINDLSLYTLKTVHIETSKVDDHVRLCQMVSDNHPGYENSSGPTEERNIMLLGETGCGKSTMLDSLINYAAGVSPGDNFRFAVINKTDEERARAHKQHESQTRGITCYRIPKVKEAHLNYRLNLIDTPGFNDTGGVDCDENIPKYLEVLLKECVEYLTAICIVIKVSDNKLKKSQSYVFQKIIEMFGKNIKDNIFVFITHYDGCKQKHCLKVIDECGIRYKDHFCFNNSILLDKCPSSETWDNNTTNFDRFFQVLSKVQPRTVDQCIDVMKERRMLNVKLERFQEKLQTHIENITSDSYRIRQRKFVGKNSINCPQCKETCHPNCWIPANFLIRLCCAMSGGNCVMCAGGCQSKLHVVDKYNYINKFTNKPLDKNDLEKATKNEEDTEKSIKALVEGINEILFTITKLHKIALFPGEIDFVKYINDMIDKENRERLLNYNKRIEYLNQLRKINLQKGYIDKNDILFDKTDS